MCRVGQHWDASVSLNRDEILDAEIKLLELGPHALTMRALAERLEVNATALYYWFAFTLQRKCRRHFDEAAIQRSL